MVCLVAFDVLNRVNFLFQIADEIILLEKDP